MKYEKVTVEVREDYAQFFKQLVEALNQSQRGKGAERHGGDIAFDDQPIRTEPRQAGSPHGLIFQARKKLLESARIAEHSSPGKARAEVFGAIVYAGALACYYEDQERQDAAREVATRPGGVVVRPGLERAILGWGS